MQFPSPQRSPGNSDGCAIRIMIADSNPYVREALSTFLSAQDDIDLVAEATNGSEVVNEYLRAKPDIVLMDLLILGGTEGDVMSSLHEIAPHAMVILLTNSRGIHLRTAAQAAGASRLIYKHIPGEVLLKVIREVVTEKEKDS